MNRQELIDSPACDGICCYRSTSNVSACCIGCPKVRKEFYETGGLIEFTPEDKFIVKKLWDEKFGFYSETGCKLPRRLMPTECLEYSCKGKISAIYYRWDGLKWSAFFASEGTAKEWEEFFKKRE